MSKKTDNKLLNAYERLSERISPIAVLVFVIAAQLIFTLFIFCNEKDNFHSDEICSYGLANSYYQPFISAKDGVYIEDITAEDYCNVNEWLPGSVMNDYLTVQPGERFAYDSVYHNQTLDHHPPLYYMLLHTVCSFFPNTFSPYFGFFLNCIFLVVTQVFLYKLSRLVFRSKFYALLVCTFYAVGIGALSTFIFIRQYSMLTMLTMMYVYFNAKLFYDPEENVKKKLPPIAVTAFAAFMTHYYAIVFIGAFTAFFCLVWLFRKKIKKMFVYGGAVLATLLVFFAVYPAALMQMGNNSFGGKTKLGYFTQLRVFIAYIARNNMGLRISVFNGYAIHTITAVTFSLAVISVPLCFLFRNEEWFARFKKALARYIKNVLLNIKNVLLHGDRFPVIIILASLADLLVVNSKVNVVRMGAYSQRYIFNIFPFGSFFAVYAVRLIAYLLPKVKNFAKVIAVVCIAFLTVDMHNIESTQFTMTSYPRFQQIRDDLAGKNCLIVFSGEDPGRITNFTAFTHKCGNVFYATSDDPEIYKKAITDADIDIDCVIISSGGYALSDTQKEIYIEKLGEGIKAVISPEEVSTLEDDSIDLDKIAEFSEMLDSYFGDKELVPDYVMSINDGFFYVMSVC